MPLATMKAAEKKLLALDFDGVICDSAVECMVTAYNAYNLVEGNGRERILGRNELDEGLAGEFLRYRPLVRIAKEYYLLWDRLITGMNLDAHRALEALDADESLRMEEFHIRFYQEREYWRTRDLEGWLAANPVYAGMKEILSEGSDRMPRVIISAKDQAAIDTILRYNGVRWQGGGIYGSETGLDKEDLMIRASKESGVPLSRIFFLDDNLENLRMAGALGVNVYMAGWGYSLAREKEAARKLGIPAVPLQELKNWVHGLIDACPDRH